MSTLARYYMIGGFLGAGKTTAVAALAEHLTKAGRRVGLITNDQGRELVDTALLRSRGFATEEIPGGCFCCRFNSLVDAAQRLTEVSRPDVFVAEPVGSCTDLMATVSYPLRRIYGDRFTLAPMSVLVDPLRAEQVFGLTEGRKFSSKVLYIWRKQVEEADIVVITKSDLMESARLAELRAALDREYPGKTILEVSVRTGKGVTQWFDLLETMPPGSSDAVEINYDEYAEGEALLGWLNATVQVRATDAVDSSALLRLLAETINGALPDSEIAHLKMTLSPQSSLAGEIAAISLVRSNWIPELSSTLEEKVHAGEIIVNCRAEADPELLKGALKKAIAAAQGAFSTLALSLEDLEYFRPGRPEPTHRLNLPGVPACS